MFRRSSFGSLDLRINFKCVLNNRQIRLVTSLSIGYFCPPLDLCHRALLHYLETTLTCWPWPSLSDLRCSNPIHLADKWRSAIRYIRRCKSTSSSSGCSSPTHLLIPFLLLLCCAHFFLYSLYPSFNKQAVPQLSIALSCIHILAHSYSAMHFNASFSSLLALFALAGSASAHGVLTAVKGANGVTAQGFGVISTTPRTGTTRNPFQQDTSIIRNIEIQTNRAGVCGRTLAGGNNNVATQLAGIYLSSYVRRFSDLILCYLIHSCCLGWTSFSQCGWHRHDDAASS